MKTTEIMVRAFNCTFSIALKRKEYLTVEDALAYVHKDITDTGMVICVTHVGEKNKVIKNKNYINPLAVIDTAISKQYLRTNG